MHHVISVYTSIYYTYTKTIIRNGNSNVSKSNLYIICRFIYHAWIPRGYLWGTRDSKRRTTDKVVQYVRLRRANYFERNPEKSRIFYREEKKSLDRMSYYLFAKRESNLSVICTDCGTLWLWVRYTRWFHAYWAQYTYLIIILVQREEGLLTNQYFREKLRGLDDASVCFYNSWPY